MRTYKKGKKSTTKKSTTKKRGGASRGTHGKGSRAASANLSASLNEAPAPLPLKRSLTCTHLIYNSLHNHEEKQEFLKDLFEKTQINIILRVMSKDMTDDIILRLNDTETGVYITWLRDKTELVTISIHTGMYYEGATHKMVKSCIKKGNAHIFFNDLKVSPNQIKITASDELIITPVKCIMVSINMDLNILTRTFMYMIKN